MTYEGFIGPAYQLDSVTADAQECINLYPEQIESQPGKFLLRGTPGLELWFSMTDGSHTTGPVRGMLQTDDYLYVVTGPSLFRRAAAGGTITYMGDVTTDAGHSPVYMHAETNQLFIVSAGNAYYHDGATLNPIAFSTASSSTVDRTWLGSHCQIDWTAGAEFTTYLTDRFVTIAGATYKVLSVESATRLYTTGPVGTIGATVTGATMEVTNPTDALTSAYINGYVLINPVSSAHVYFCRPYNFASWNALSVFRKEGYSDHIARVLVHDNTIWLLGYETAEMWANTGASADRPFERIGSGPIPQGTAARWAACGTSKGVATIGWDRKAYILAGGRPQRISTHAIEQRWATFSGITDATAYTCQENGHELWVITFHAGNETWVYDVTTGMWHRRAYGTDRQLQQFYQHWLSQDRHIVGSRVDNKIYTVGDQFTDDAGTAITATRVAPYVSNGVKMLFFKRFEVLMQRGTKSGGGSGTVTMDYSNDGLNWSTARTASTGILNNYLIRCFWHRLGRARARLFRIKIADAQKRILLGADIEVSSE